MHEAFRNIAAGAHLLLIRNGIKKAAETALRELVVDAKPITTKEEISKVAAISCQDEQLGNMIGEALHTVGPEGVITIDDSNRFETTLDIQEGIVFDRGFLSPFMATDERQIVAELYDPYILICDTKFEDPHDLLPTLIAAAEDGRSCLIISEGVEGEAMGLILKNKREGDMDIVCVTAPLYGEGRRWRMEDLAIQTSGTFVTKELRIGIREVTREMLGTAAYVKVTKERTVITGADGDPAAIEKKIQEIKHLIEHTDYEFNKARYKERLARFVSGVAKIDVGGRTEPEIWDRKMRIEDAVNAARAAYEEGVVPGGGIALLNLVPRLKELSSELEGDERAGVLAVISAMKAPARQIVINAGLDGTAIVERLLNEAPGTGYDVSQDKFVNMFEVGVFDPVKVTRLALECALSVSSTLLTTEAGITDLKDVAKDVRQERRPA